MSATTASETTALLASTQSDNLQRSVSDGSHPGYASISSSEENGLDGEEVDFETTYKKEGKILARYATPLVITYMLQYSYNIVIIYVCGQIGTNELGAASLATMIVNVTGWSVYEGLATALDTLTSQAYGGGKKKLVGIHVQRMAALVFVITILIAALWLLAPFLLEVIVPEKELVRLAAEFLRYYLVGALGYGLFEVGKRFTQAQGNFTPSMVAAAVCAPLNIFWNWLFVWKMGLGFKGAALAPAVSFTLQPIVLVIYINIFVRDSLECWPGFSLKQSFKGWGHMVKLGGSGIVMILSEWLAFDILTLVATYISTEALAAQSVLTTVAITMYHIPQPTSIAASTRFGNLIGHGALKAARKAAWFYYMVFLGIGLFDLVLLSSLRYFIAEKFTKDPAVRPIIAATVPLMAGAQLLDAFAANANGLLRGLGRQHVGGAVNLGVYYLWAIPLSLGLTFGPAKLGVTGLWIGPLSGLFLVSVIVSIYLKKADWRKAVEEARLRNE